MEARVQPGYPESPRSKAVLVAGVAASDETLIDRLSFLLEGVSALHAHILIRAAIAVKGFC